MGVDPAGRGLQHPVFPDRIRFPFSRLIDVSHPSS
jgi:hypothetical protein